jgi:hypothetical protein
MTTPISDESWLSEIEAKVPNPTQQNYAEHFAALGDFNASFRLYAESFLDTHELNDLISSEIGRWSSNPGVVTALACLGSDGREENAACSPLDIVALVINSGIDQPDIPNVSKRVAEAFRKNCQSKLFGEFEVKVMERPLAYFDGDRNKLWPDRVTDAQPINETDRVLVRHAQQVLIDQLRNETSGEQITMGRRVIEKFRERIKSYNKICTQGKQTCHGEVINHFDLQQGLSFFNDSVSRRSIGPSSFKQNALRGVQNAVNRRLFGTFIDDSPDKAKKITEEFPANTIDRLSFLRSEGMTSGDFSQTIMGRLQDNYKYFLWQYHLSEWNYSKRGETSVPIDSSEVGKRMSDLINDVKTLANANPTALSVRVLEKL